MYTFKKIATIKGVIITIWSYSQGLPAATRSPAIVSGRSILHVDQAIWDPGWCVERWQQLVRNLDCLRFEHFFSCQSECGQETAKISDVCLKDRDIPSHLIQVKMLGHPVPPFLELLVKAHDEEGVEGVDDGGTH